MEDAMTIKVNFEIADAILNVRYAESDFGFANKQVERLSAYKDLDGRKRMNKEYRSAVDRQEKAKWALYDAKVELARWLIEATVDTSTKDLRQLMEDVIMGGMKHDE